MAIKAKPDGYTLLPVSSASVMNPVVRRLPYDSLTALAFVAKLGASFQAYSVNPSVPVQSVRELLAMTTANPAEITNGSSGRFIHFALALLKKLTQRNFNIIVYNGGRQP